MTKSCVTMVSDEGYSEEYLVAHSIELVDGLLREGKPSARDDQDAPRPNLFRPPELAEVWIRPRSPYRVLWRQAYSHAIHTPLTVTDGLLVAVEEELGRVQLTSLDLDKFGVLCQFSTRQVREQS